MQGYKTLFLLLCAVCMYASASARQRGDTVSVYFPFNESSLPLKQQELLDSLSYSEVLIPGNDLMIVGYADFPGSNEYNDALSRRRADAVRIYLATLGFKKENIELCTGKGELEHAAADTGKGYAPDRRVDIVVLHKKKKASLTTQGQVKAVVPVHPSSKTIPAAPFANTNRQDVTHLISSKHAIIAKPPVVLKDLTGIITMPPDATILLDKIFFPSGRHFVTRNSEKQLEELYDVLNSHPGVRIRIEGHVCCIYDYITDALDEDDGTNLLSVHRAQFVYEYLISRGIDRSRLEYVGFGHSRPVIMHEQTEDDAQQNRRVEIRILTH